MFAVPNTSKLNIEDQTHLISCSCSCYGFFLRNILLLLLTTFWTVMDKLLHITYPALLTVKKKQKKTAII